MPLAFVVGGAILILSILIHRLSSNSNVPIGATVPPNPTGVPLFGNLFDIPSQHSWLKFKSWADQYGPIFRLSIFGRNLIVVSTEQVANDLLRERGNIYSSREQLPMAAQLMSQNLRPLLLPYGGKVNVLLEDQVAYAQAELWRRGRKLMHSVTMHTAATSYQPVQVYESERMLYDLVKTPEKYESIFERYAGAVIMRLAYGKTIETGDEPYVRDALKVVHTVERVASPGAYLVDTFPILMHLPTWLAPFKREASQLHEFELSLFRKLLSEVRDKMKAGKPQMCFATTFLERRPEFGLSDDEGAYVIGTLFEAGAGTTAAAMMSFVLAMCQFPNWQTRLQQEVDNIVGDARMPDFGDIVKLPTVRAIAKETLRWRPVTAGGVPHQLIKDDVYKGFFFPAGTVVHANQWAIHHDPELYPDPEAFNPGRWLSPEYPTYREPLEKYPNLQNFSAFGFGRRICPGMNIAENSLHLLIARMAWTTVISKKPGVEVPWYDYTTGFNVQPRPFAFDLRVRSERRMEILYKNWELGKDRDPMNLP